MKDDASVLIPISGKIEHADLIAAMLPLLRFQTTNLTLLHVIETPISTPLGSEGMDDIFKESENKIRPIRDWLNSQGYVATIKIVTARHVEEAIAEEGGSGEYSMIFMMKRRKKKGLLGRFSKSVTEAVIRSVDCPVVTILV
ncbi:MAG: universal stress protein [Candidatus Thorarchaeota archaeon]|nr:universal stress protein [Candidatus Thorarchaeota archaeon]